MRDLNQNKESGHQKLHGQLNIMKQVMKHMNGPKDLSAYANGSQSLSHFVANGDKVPQAHIVGESTEESVDEKIE